MKFLFLSDKQIGLIKHALGIAERSYSGLQEQYAQLERVPAVDSNFVTSLVNYLKPLPEGSMYALAESEFTLETGGTCKGFGKKDGIAVLVMGKDSFYPVSKMDKADIEFMFITTTLSQHLERGNFIVMAIEDCQQNEPINHD